MPFGIPVLEMSYYPNQQELQLTWHSKKRGDVHRTTYAGVPVEVGNALFQLKEAKESMSYITKNITRKFNGVRLYRVSQRIKL